VDTRGTPGIADASAGHQGRSLSTTGVPVGLTGGIRQADGRSSDQWGGGGGVRALATQAPLSSQVTSGGLVKPITWTAAANAAVRMPRSTRPRDDARRRLLALPRAWRRGCGGAPQVMSERLGHATVAFTLDTYTSALPAMDKSAADVVAGLILGTEEVGRSKPAR
jgi:hypothetical protein